MAPVVRNMSGALPVEYRIAVHNNANVPLTIKRVDISSIGVGAYSLEPIPKPFDAAVAPATTGAVEFWASGNIGDPTIIGANGPVTLRVVVLFDSPAGQFQKVITAQVHTKLQ